MSEDPKQTLIPGALKPLDLEAIALIEDRIIHTAEVLEKAVAAAAAAVEKLRVLRFMLADLRNGPA